MQRRAWRLCERLLVLAEKSDGSGFKLQAHHAAWATAFGRGELADVETHAQAGLALYDATHHQAMASSYGNHDASTCARNFWALSLALAGDEERARSIADTSVAVARSLGDPFSLALTLAFAAFVAQVLGDVALAAQHAEQSRQIATDHEIPIATAWSTGVAAWCAAENGETRRGIELLSQTIATLEAAHARHFMSFLLGLLADAHLKAGDPAEAMTAVERGLSLNEDGGERYFLAELYRLKGELLARPPSARRDQAHEAFRNAIKIAKAQGARVLERRAEESLRRWGGPLHEGC